MNQRNKYHDWIKVKVNGNFICTFCGYMFIVFVGMLFLIFLLDGTANGNFAEMLALCLCMYCIGQFLVACGSWRYLMAESNTHEIVLKQFLRRDKHYELSDILSIHIKDFRIAVQLKENYYLLRPGRDLEHQSEYDSWEELGQSYLYGYKHWLGTKTEINEKLYDDRSASYEYLCLVKYPNGVAFDTQLKDTWTTQSKK